MSRRMTWLVAAACMGLLAAGCSSVSPRAAAGNLLAYAVAAADEAGETSEGPGLAHALVLYLPNRVLDVTDVVSVNVGVPFIPKKFLAGFVHVNGHVTRAVQVGFGASNENVRLGKGYKRRIAWFSEQRELSAGPITLCKHVVKSGNNKTDFSKIGMLLPTDEPFTKGLMDYWAVGGEATVLPIAVQAEAHPVEILDVLLGFFFIDLGKDDL